MGVEGKGCEEGRSCGAGGLQGWTGEEELGLEKMRGATTECMEVE
jgi:hypothetical protein